MADVLCVMERMRSASGFAVVRHVWHAVAEGGDPGNWLPILCAPGEGIIAPGSTEMRRPTCPACRKALATKET